MMFLARTLNRRWNAGAIDEARIHHTWAMMTQMTSMLFFSNIVPLLVDDPEIRLTFVTNMVFFRNRVFQAKNNETDEHFITQMLDNTQGVVTPDVAFAQELEAQNKRLDTVAQLRQAVWSDEPGGVKMTARENGLSQTEQDEITQTFSSFHRLYAESIDHAARLDLLANPQFLDEPLSEEAEGWLRADPMAAARACNRYVREFYGGATPELRAIERAQADRDVLVARRPRENAYTVGV